MAETMRMLLAMSVWMRTILVVVLCLVVLVQFLRLTPPFRRPGDATSGAETLDGLLGRTGRTLTPLRPVGMCEIDRRRVECIAESGYVEKDACIEVVRVEGMQPTVRVTDQV